MANTQKAFSLNSKNLLFQVTLLALGIMAGLGVHLPSAPELIAGDIVNTLSSSGIYAVIGIMIVSVIGPIYNFWKSKPKLSFAAFAADPNNWVYIVSFAASCLILIGVNVPDGTAQQIVNAIFVKDWASLTSVMVSSVIVPLVRFFIDKHNQNIPSV